MKKEINIIFIALFVFLAVEGCKGTQHLAETVTVTGVYPEHSRRDTCYLHDVKYDSIYINNFHYVDHGKDTVVIRDKTTEFRYHMLHDTIKVIRRDSIPYEVKVIETKTERYTPWYAKALAFIGFLVLLWFVIKLIVKWLKS